MRRAVTILVKAGGRFAGIVRRRGVTLGVGAALAIATASAGGAAGHLFSENTGSAAPAATAALTAKASAGAAARAREHRAPLVRALVTLVAKDTGQSRATVIADLRAGRSLNDIAGAPRSSRVCGVTAARRERTRRSRVCQTPRGG